MTIQARIQKNFEKQHFMSYLGAKLETIEEGRVSISVEKAAHLSQQTGFIHAGVITTIADSAAGYAAWSMMPENSDVLSVEFKVNLMRPASGSKIIAHAQVIKSGRQITVVEADVKDVDTGKVIAKFQGTMISVPAQTE